MQFVTVAALAKYLLLKIFVCVQWESCVACLAFEAAFVPFLKWILLINQVNNDFNGKKPLLYQAHSRYLFSCVYSFDTTGAFFTTTAEFWRHLLFFNIFFGKSFESSKAKHKNDEWFFSFELLKKVNIIKYSAKYFSSLCEIKTINKNKNTQF